MVQRGSNTVEVKPNVAMDIIDALPFEYRVLLALEDIYALDDILNESVNDLDISFMNPTSPMYRNKAPNRVKETWQRAFSNLIANPEARRLPGYEHPDGVIRYIGDNEHALWQAFLENQYDISGDDMDNHYQRNRVVTDTSKVIKRLIAARKRAQAVGLDKLFDNEMRKNLGNERWDAIRLAIKSNDTMGMIFKPTELIAIENVCKAVHDAATGVDDKVMANDPEFAKLYDRMGVALNSSMSVIYMDEDENEKTEQFNGAEGLKINMEKFKGMIDKCPEILQRAALNTYKKYFGIVSKNLSNIIEDEKQCAYTSMLYSLFLTLHDFSDIATTIIHHSFEKKAKTSPDDLSASDLDRKSMDFIKKVVSDKYPAFGRTDSLSRMDYIRLFLSINDAKYPPGITHTDLVKIADNYTNELGESEQENDRERLRDLMGCIRAYDQYRNAVTAEEKDDRKNDWLATLTKLDAYQHGPDRQPQASNRPDPEQTKLAFTYLYNRYAMVALKRQKNDTESAKCAKISKAALDEIETKKIDHELVYKLAMLAVHKKYQDAVVKGDDRKANAYQEALTFIRNDYENYKKNPPVPTTPTPAPAQATP